MVATSSATAWHTLRCTDGFSSTFSRLSSRVCTSALADASNSLYAECGASSTRRSSTAASERKMKFSEACIISSSAGTIRLPTLRRSLYTISAAPRRALSVDSKSSNSALRLGTSKPGPPSPPDIVGVGF